MKNALGNAKQMLIKCAIRRNDKSNKRTERLNERGSKNDKRKKKTRKGNTKIMRASLVMCLSPQPRPQKKMLLNLLKTNENM